MTLCIGCGKKFNYNGNFIKHLTLKKCIRKYIYICPNSYRNDFEKINQLFSKQFETFKNTDSKLKYGCEVCGKIFTTKSYLYRHIKKCKIKLENIDNKQTSILTNCESKLNDKINSKTNNKNNKIQDMNSVNSLKRKKLIPKIHINKQKNNSDNITKEYSNQYTNSSNNNSNNNSVNGNQSNTIINNNINNNIIIKNFNDDNDDEILSSIPKNIKEQLMRKPKSAITDLYKLIHIDKPEYRNVYINNPKDGFGMIMQNGNWTPIKMKELLDDAIVKNSDRIFDIMNDETINIRKSDLSRLTNILELVADNGSITSELRMKIKLLTFQFKDLITQTYNESSNRKINHKRLKVF
jgi:hypothetical protein